MEDLLDHLGAVFLVTDVRRAVYVEGETAVIHELEVPDRDVFRIERILHCLAELHRKPLHVENIGLLSCSRIDHIVARALGGAPTVPELVAAPEPGRSGLGGENHLRHFLARESGSKVVVGCGYVIVLGGQGKDAQKC